MSKQIDSVLDIQVSMSDCPFREFRDNELSIDYWGLEPIAFKTALKMGKGGSKSQSDHLWIDDQIQPLPRSARKRLHGWARAEDLAQSQWEADVFVFDDNNGGKMSTADMQFAHHQVFQMSSFCRRVLSMCYMLERAEGFTVEHQWDNFVFSVPPEGWRARFHIYSPGMKHGGGQQHRPTLSKNGCYLVRLYYIGAWRCVWVSDQVPVDSSGAPLLPFAPFFNQTTTKPAGRQTAVNITSTTVHLWPLLLCKALLKLAAPDMNSDDDSDYVEDEPMEDMDIMHALTGSLNVKYYIEDADELWKLITSEVQLFTWDEDDETYSSTVKSKTKRPGTKENSVIKRRSLTTILIEDSRNMPPFTIPEITPAFEMHLLVVMARDLPLKKPLPEPEVAPWKHHRWIDWARKHGLYEAFDCPRTRFLKLNGLLKLSLAPHLLDVQSTESVRKIKFDYKEVHGRTTPVIKKAGKDKNPSVTTNQSEISRLKEELREWVQFDAIQKLMKSISTLCFPSMYQFCSIASNPPIRITKLPPKKELDIPAPKNEPLYLQIDAPEEIYLKISCSMLHPRVFLNANQPIDDCVEPGYVLVEVFQWFTDCELPKSKAYLQTRGYDANEVSFKPGRHFCRLWIHSRVPWYVMLLSESTIHVGTRDVIQMAAIRECSWASRFLTNLGAAFQTFIRANKSTTFLSSTDRAFYRSYKPDLDWNSKEVGFSKSHVHWMFRQALQSTLEKKLAPFEYRSVCAILQNYFNDPDFGLSKKRLSSMSKNLCINDLCNCPVSEAEELEVYRIHYNDTDIDNKSFDEYTKNKLQPSVCDATSVKLPYGVLKSIRDEIIKRHEAATSIQAHWRGIRTRRCLDSRVTLTPEITKYLTENVFENQETLSALVNEFFYMFPGAKSAYSVSSALAGTSGLKQYNGISPVTSQYTWVPYFQGVFFCHAPVKIHFDLQSTIGINKVNSTFEVYNNDTKTLLPQAYTAHLTFDFSPNIDGYTVIGHGILKQPVIASSEIRWQFTVMSSVESAFHICDNDMDGCKELPILSVMKLHLEEIFIPNERNILGGIQIYVLKHETISFRASATSLDLEMEAVLRTTGKSGEVIELATCLGIGEIYWPFIRLAPETQSNSCAYVNLPLNESVLSSFRSHRKYGKPASAGIKVRSSIKVKDQRLSQDAKSYFIEVRAPKGWPLTLAQWKRVIEIQNYQEFKTEVASKKSLREKVSSAKDKEKTEPPIFQQPQPGDAYVQLECSLSADTGVFAKRDDTRDLQFAAELKSWEASEPGRNVKGAQYRKEFREEFLEYTTALFVENTDAKSCEILENDVSEEFTKNRHIQGPTPATVSEVSEAYVDFKNEDKYLTMPQELQDKFKPLDFIPLCTRERNDEDRVIITPEMLEDYKKSRKARIEEAMERMNQLQIYNDVNILEAQKVRCERLEKLFVDSQWSPGLIEALEARDNTVAGLTLNRSVSSTRKKQERKKK